MIYVSGLAALTLVTWGGIAIYQQFFNPNRDLMQGDTVVQKITPEVRVAAVGEVLDCLSRGRECERFDDAKTYLGQMAHDGRLVYTPMGDGDPGEAQVDGTKVVVISSLDDAQVQSLASVVLRDGAVGADTITKNTVEVSSDGLVGTYKVPATAESPATTGQMTFVSPSGGRTEGDEQLVSITYKVEG